MVVCKERIYIHPQVVEAPKSSPHDANERLIWTNDPQILGKLIPWRVAVTRAMLIYNCEFGIVTLQSRFYLYVAVFYN